MAEVNKLKVRTERVRKLLNETILRYTDVIDYDDELSIYDQLIKNFMLGNLDDVFLTENTKGLNEEERNELFQLVHKYNGLCLKDGNVKEWINSCEGMFDGDCSLIAEQILDSFDFLLRLVRFGGEEVLKQLNSISESDKFDKTAPVQYLRNTFVSDSLLSGILLDMAMENSLYDIFTPEQKAILLTYPEGTLYSYTSEEFNITYPLLLGVQIYNDFEGKIIDSIEDDDVLPLRKQLKNYFANEDIDFLEEVLLLSDKYRDYSRRRPIYLEDDEMKIVYDYTGDDIQEAWASGDELLGGAYDTPYPVVNK